jgi:hypothetical protein
MDPDESCPERDVMRMLDDVLARLRGGLYDIAEGSLPRTEARCLYDMARRALDVAQPIAEHTRQFEGDFLHRIHKLEATLLDIKDQLREMLD